MKRNKYAVRKDAGLPVLRTSIPNCSQCGKTGQVINQRDEVTIYLGCQCGHKWYSLAGTCPECQQANGYPNDGLCERCYGKRLKNRGVAV